MKTIKIAWQRSKLLTILIFIQYIIALFFLYAAIVLPQLELQMGVGALGIAFASIASTDWSSIQNAYKLDQILTKLDELHKQEE